MPIKTLKSFIKSCWLKAGEVVGTSKSQRRARKILNESLLQQACDKWFLENNSSKIVDQLD